MSQNNEKKVHGIVAEYTSVDTLLDACRRVRDAGYKKTDAYTPFPVHGIDKALGIKPTVLPWIVLVCGLTGTLTGLGMQIWMNGIDYPYIISGKPYISLPAFMPVVFELTILFASFGAFFGMWALNGLPRFSNPVFTDPRFDRVTDDRFFLYIDSTDDRFEAVGVEQLFRDTGSEYIEKVVDDDSSAKVPRPFFIAWALLVGLSVIPLLLVLKMRVTTSESPRFHIFYDMDFSPAKDAQQTTTLFADGRAMRPDVPGTVARGELGPDLNLLTGIDMDELARIDSVRAERLVRAVAEPFAPQPPAEEGDEEEDNEQKVEEEGEEASADKAPAEKESTTEPTAEQDNAEQDAEEKDTASEEPADEKPATEEAASEATAEQDAAAESEVKSQPSEEQPEDSQPEPTESNQAESNQAGSDQTGEAGGQEPSVMDTTPWLAQNPVEVTPKLLERGQTYFGIYCAVCHGVSGNGNGLVNRRAQKILAPTWLPPTRLTQETLYEDVYPDGKLFNTISKGIRKMPGYAGQIEVKDRWAIVAYVRALQRSQDASIDAVPQSKREQILKRQSEIEKQLAEQAAEEAEDQASEQQAEAS